MDIHNKRKVNTVPVSIYSQNRNFIYIRTNLNPMCYYNGCYVSKAEFLRLLAIEKELKNLDLSRPLQSGFDYSDCPIIKPVGNNDIEIVNAHWEFIAPWCKNWAEVETGRKQYTTLNAAGEKLFESRLYKDAALKRRCLVLSSGFYEWRHIKYEGDKKITTYPYYISMADREYFFMAGIWQPWTDRETGETIDTFAIVTTAANDLMSQIHNTKKRMPVILSEEQAHNWIFGDLDKDEVTKLAATQADSENMVAWPVAKDVRTAKDPMQEVDYPELPPLL
jgi:putative SOS response-associated peptidase YedK